MNFKQIETFLWIARLGSFAAAAERLQTTQSAVSVRIHELEQALGVKLFDRRHRGAKLTPKGQDLIGMAEHLMVTVDKIQSSIGDPNSLAGVVRVGVADLIAITWLSDLIPKVCKHHPNATLDLEVGMAVELIDKLRRGDLDVVLVPGDIWADEFEAVSLGNAEFLWMASPRLILPPRKLTPRDLQQWPIITLSRQSYHHRVVHQWFKSGDAVTRQIVFCNSNSVIVALTIGGLGVGLIPPHFVHNHLDDGSLIIVDAKPDIPPVEFFALMPRDNASPLARVIAQMAARASPFPKKAPERRVKRRGNA